MVVIITHAVFLNGKDVYGPPHAISQYLNKRGLDHVFLKHRLDSDGDSLVDLYRGGKHAESRDIGTRRRLFFQLQYLFECLISLIIIKQYKEVSVVIGVDPLNAIAAIIAKRLGWVTHAVYFSADFALVRFSNNVLNSIYHLLDHIAMKYTDQTWSVSSRIVRYRKTQGLSSQKNKLLPNAPFFDSVNRKDYSHIHPKDIVLVAAMENAVDFFTLIDALILVWKKEPACRLILIGDGSRRESIHEYLVEKRLQKNVKFCGALSHDDMFQVLVESGIGVAIYADSSPTHYRYFSDPMKVRDYLASGLPVVITGNSNIGEELQEHKAGFQVQLDAKSIATAILTLLGNQRLHKTYRDNAIKMAKTYDTYSRIDQYISPYLMETRK